MKKIMCFLMAGLLAVSFQAFAKTVVYSCPAAGKIQLPKCRAVGSKNNIGCMWQAKLNVNPPLKSTPATQRFLTAASLKLPYKPQRLMFVQYVRSTSLMICAYQARQKFCASPGNCYNGGSLQWGPLPGKCHLSNAQTNAKGSHYCIGGAKTCTVVCDQ